MSEQEQRAAVIAEAKTWVGTPYHHMGRVKGAGVDCGMYLLEVFERVGLIEHVEPAYYPPDWMLHRDQERYLGHMLDHTKEIVGPPKPADLLAVQFGRCYSHGAIVVEWPLCLHAMLSFKVGYVDALTDACFREGNGDLRPFKFFTFWGVDGLPIQQRT